MQGVLLDIQKYFTLGDSTAGLMHTVFILCFLFAAPLFGYLGDRYNRKVILGAGIFLWSGVTLGSSFISESMAWLFFISRGLVGAGTASYSTLAPTIIADLFEKDHRTWMLSLFYIFIPVGSGFGYILSSGMAQATGHWSWGFRVTPCMGVVGLALLIFLVPESANYGTEKKTGEHAEASTWLKDISSLCKNWSFLWSSLGVTAMGFVTGALSFWVPVFLYRAQLVLQHVPPCEKVETCNTANSRIFGGITIATGILGVVTGAEAARRYKKINAKADPLICALGSLTSAPCMYLAIMLAQESILATYIFIALAEFLLSLNWAVVTDILLYVVKPACQSTAVSLQIFVSHLLGDAGSPYLIGIIADTIQGNQGDRTYLWDFRSLQYSFVLCTFVGVLGGGCFLMTALHIEEDQKKAATPPVPGTENKSYISHEEGL
ncbi:protein spinster homolog 3 isoform X2 [Sceloporus undulatus]|uniref:protein spinster homolog 3 isoform X2 n=1 Tax=Sceloporus undulatus TaxID=8520 RepID=UPI001C4DBEC8|nr:protein spinster homolog 3 isoform X2 [Sceloporus undulatus]XP_042298142.1 protein spinster homolog 3 isoform X2 [Sceloporus undulatus]XP_042298143.1 protein spinster homolog 3 isoform X2 [Sceloporus undulatus]XP_042298145.1 protein spinster homolog 3 isoform X2 [Sceloporus undulatus]